jgi:hypothetical protein
LPPVFTRARDALADLHYDLLAPLGRDVHNARNYFQRAVPAPLALAIIALLVATRGAWALAHLRSLLLRAGRLVPYAIAWFVVWIALVLPLPARSELYLYGAGFGLCLLPGSWRTRPAMDVTRESRHRVLIVAFGGYRRCAPPAVAAWRVSAALATALAVTSVRAHTGVVILIHTVTEDLLEAAVGGARPVHSASCSTARTSTRRELRQSAHPGR